jgi:CBS domain-containing protein
MTESFRLKDLLIPLSEYAVTSVDRPLREVIPPLRNLYCEVEGGKCTEAGHRTVLVLDATGRLVGILDFRSILKALIPEIARNEVASHRSSQHRGAASGKQAAPTARESRLGLRERVTGNADTRVGRVMLEIRGSIDSDADIVDALTILYRNKLTVIPVYEDGRLIGVVRDSDLFLRVADLLPE